jgi:ATP-dependent RNA helicase DDX19/DBP5
VGKCCNGQNTITGNICFTFAVPRGTKLKEHIIIGTPGKVLDWGVKYRFFDLGKISVFVLDEADVMIATQGHQDQSFRIHK